MGGTEYQSRACIRLLPPEHRFREDCSSLQCARYIASLPDMQPDLTQASCGLQVPKVLLFTDKEATPPLFAALSSNLRSKKLLFADVHSSQKAVMEQFGVAKVGMIA